MRGGSGWGSEGEREGGEGRVGKGERVRGLDGWWGVEGKESAGSKST